MIPLEDLRPDTPEPNARKASELEVDTALNALFECDEEGWQQYTHEDLYGDNQDEPTGEQEHEPELEDEAEPEPQPEPELNDSGRLTARAKGKGLAPGPPRCARC